MTKLAQENRREALRQLGDSFATVTDALLDRGISLEEAVAAFEARLVRAALERHGGNLSQAALTLGIHRNTLRSKLHRNGSRPGRQ